MTSRTPRTRVAFVLSQIAVAFAATTAVTLAGGARAGAAGTAPEETGAVSDVGGVAATAAPPAASADAAASSAGFLPSLDGPIGLYRMSTAEVGPRHHLRFGLHGQYFSSSNFLINGDKETVLAGGLTFGFTPLRRLEIFGGFYTASDRNQRTSDAGRADPEVIRSHGDIVIGPKLAAPVARGFSLGFEGGLRFLSSSSGLSFSPGATSFWLGPLATLDLDALAGLPLRFHASASYYVDNSNDVTDLSGTNPASREAIKFAYGVSASRVRLAVGVDAPFDQRVGGVPLRPFAEYHAEIITADADPALAALMPTGGSRERQWVTFGLRARIPGGVTLDVGGDVRLHANSFEYAPPTPTYDVVFGASYPLDIDAFTRPVVVTRVVEKVVAPPPPAEGRIAGTAKDKQGKAIGRAIVSVVGRPHAAVATDADGTFEIAGVAPGPTKLEVSAADFETEKATVAVTAGKVAELDVALVAKIRPGTVRGKTTDGQGHALQATLRFSGAQNLETQSDDGGFFRAALAPGAYRVVVEAPGLPQKEAQLDVAAGGERQMEMTLRPVSPDLTLTAEEVVLRTPIHFRTGAPKLTPVWQAELDGVAAVLEDHPEWGKLRIEAHWDTSAGAKAQALTEQQAAAVKDYLVKKGAPAARLEAAGVGADRPLVPNVSPVYRAQNRRVELHIVR